MEILLVISFILIIRNRKAFLRDDIATVFEKTYQNWKVIVISGQSAPTPHNTSIANDQNLLAVLRHSIKRKQAISVGKSHD